jgi:hypothetical protein
MCRRLIGSDEMTQVTGRVRSSAISKHAISIADRLHHGAHEAPLILCSPVLMSDDGLSLSSTAMALGPDFFVSGSCASRGIAVSEYNRWPIAGAAQTAREEHKRRFTVLSY